MNSCGFSVHGVLSVVFRAKAETIGITENTLFFTTGCLKIADAQNKLSIPT
jgi:hypothetical protein